MKKLLIATAALALVAGSAVAQSSATVSGRLDLGFSDKQLNPVAITPATSAVTTTGDVKSKSITSSPFASSFIRFAGSEDLGGGLKANFLLETALTPSTGVYALGDRGMWVEVAGNSFGALRAGTQNTMSRDVWTGFSQTGAINIVGDLNSSTAEDAGGTGGVSGFETAIKYTTPKFNGFSASVAQTMATTDTNGAKTGSDGTSFALSYAAGKFAAMAGRSSVKAHTAAVAAVAGTKHTYTITGTTITGVTGSGNCGAATVGTICTQVTAAVDAADAYKTKTDTTAAAASYDFGVAKVALIYVDKDVARSNTSTTGAVDRKSTTLQAQAPVGKADLFASYGQGSQVTAGNGFKGDLKATQVGVKYNLSKRTFGYLATGAVEHELSATTKTDYKETAVGLVHLF